MSRGLREQGPSTRANGRIHCGDARLEYSLTPDEKMIMLVGAI
jgi:hypothetical protein